MKESILLIAFIGLAVTSLAPDVMSQESGDSNISVEVSSKCEAGIFSFKQPGVGGVVKYIGLNDTGYISGRVANSGNKDLNGLLNLTVTRHENRTLEFTNQNSNVTGNESTGNETQTSQNNSEYGYVIPPKDEQANGSKYVYNYSIPFSSYEVNATSYNESELNKLTQIDNETFVNSTYRKFITEFQAFYEPGNYTARANFSYSCGNSTYSSKAAGLFEIVDLSGEGVIPDAIGETDQEVNQEVDTDAQLPDNATTEFETDANETLDEASPKEGNDQNFPGQTEVPEPQPQPQPEPVPLLSVDMKPDESIYQTPRGRFQEIGLNVTNTGEETINNLRLEPRFSEGMSWQAQGLNIGSLDVGASTNASVYVNAGEEVDPGMYQIPVYASNDENDIGNQYVNVEVTEQIFTSALTIGEAPQDISFEMSRNYTVPVLLENDGDTALQNVEVELQNAENCGEYTSEVVDEIPAGESASINIEFRTSEALEECQATLIASTDSGEFAFSDMNIQNVEEKGIVPQEFRFPIVASMWTLMLLAYAVLTKKYGLHNLTVKVPLVLLVVGEALILIYLSSVYYNLMPPGLLPF